MDTKKRKTYYGKVIGHICAVSEHNPISFHIAMLFPDPLKASLFTWHHQWSFGLLSWFCLDTGTFNVAESLLTQPLEHFFFFFCALPYCLKNEGGCKFSPFVFFSRHFMLPPFLVYFKLYMYLLRFFLFFSHALS